MRTGTVEEEDASVDEDSDEDNEEEDSCDTSTDDEDRSIYPTDHDSEYAERDSSIVCQSE